MRGKLALMRGAWGGFGKLAALKKGILLNAEEMQLLTLHLLSEHSTHGYHIIKSVGDLTSGVYAPSPGMVYPALSHLEKLSYVVSKTEGAKKLFRITQEGTVFLKAHRHQLSEVLNRIEFLGRKMAFMQQHLAQDQIADERWGATDRESAEFHDLRHEFRTALFEKLNAPAEEKARIMRIMREAIDKIRST